MNQNIIYKRLSYIWRNTFLKWYRSMKNKRIERYWHEHKKCLGKENLDKTFYIIRRRDKYPGIFSYVITTLAHIDKEIKMGRIPIIDMQNNFNIYLNPEQVGKENAWEFYFEQPYNIGLDDIKKSRNVIIGSGDIPQLFPYLDVKFLQGKTGEIEYWRKLSHKYIRLNRTTEERLKKIRKELFGEKERILGVLGRGTDYTAKRPANHPVQPNPEELLEKAKDIFEKEKCTKIFLATEDKNIYNLFKSAVGDILITYHGEFLDYKGGLIGKEGYINNKDRKESGFNYLAEIYLLSKCQCLCAGRTSGTVGALLFTEGYDYMYLFDLGIYGRDDNDK